VMALQLRPTKARDLKGERWQRQLFVPADGAEGDDVVVSVGAYREVDGGSLQPLYSVAARRARLVARA